MNGPRADRDIQGALTAWMDGVAPTQAPTQLLEDTFVQTMKTRQAPVYPWHRLALGGRRFAFAGSPAVVVLVVLGVVLAVTLAVAFGGGRPAVAPTASPTSAATASGGSQPASLPAPGSIKVEATFPFPDLNGFVLDGAVAWGLTRGRIDRIDLATFKVTGSVPLGGAADLYNDLALNDAGLWATDWDTATLYRVDPATLTVVAKIPAGLAPKGILATADGVWVADTHDGKVLRIDQATNTVAATITVGPTGSSGPNWLASGLGSIWVDIPNNGTVVRIDPVTDAIQATIQTPGQFTACGGFAIQPDAVWVSGCDASAALGRLDPKTNTAVIAVPIPGHGGPSLIGDYPWVSVDTGDATSGLLVRINPATNAIDRVLRPDVPFGGGGGILLVGGSAWVTDGWNGVVLRFPLAAFGG
ncbi:MAG: hypothetical protein HYX55_02195 [Chloroflexi bacterium]|nr:hypothetical protein [Chloroflexota bacterium]